jgi:hypothetical protein
MSSQAKPTEQAISQLLHGDKELQPPKNAKQETRLKDFDAGRVKRLGGLTWGQLARKLVLHTFTC